MMLAAALPLNNLPWDCPCPESDLAKAWRQLCVGQKRTQTLQQLTPAHPIPLQSPGDTRGPGT